MPQQSLLFGLDLDRDGVNDLRFWMGYFPARSQADLVFAPDANGVPWMYAQWLGAPATDPDLQEWDYGGYEGVTTVEIRRTRPDWNLWTDGVVPGPPGHPGTRRTGQRREPRRDGRR